MLKNYAALVVAAFVCLLPTARSSYSVSRGPEERKAPWQHDGYLDVDLKAKGKAQALAQQPAARSARRVCKGKLCVLAAAAAVAHLLICSASSLKKKPLPEWKPKESSLQAEEAAEEGEAPPDAEGDSVDLQVQLLTLDPGDAAQLSPQQRRLVEMAVESLETVEGELEVLYLNAAKIDEELRQVREEFQRSQEDYLLSEAGAAVVTSLRLAMDQLEKQSCRAWAAFDDKDAQRSLMGYTAAQEARGEELLAGSGGGRPRLSPGAAAAVAAAERVLLSFRLRKVAAAAPQGAPLQGPARDFEKTLWRHFKVLTETSQRWRGDRAALLAAAEGALEDAHGHVQQQQRDGLAEAPPGLLEAMGALEALLDQTTGPEDEEGGLEGPGAGDGPALFGSLAYPAPPAAPAPPPPAAAAAAAAAGDAAAATARVKEQMALALLASRDAGKAARLLDGSAAAFEQMGQVFKNGVGVLAVALHTEVPESVPEGVAEPFQLALQMCERSLSSLGATLQPGWLQQVEQQQQALARAAAALRQSRLHAKPGAAAWVFDWLEEDMQSCRQQLDAAKTLYAEMFSLATSRPSLPFLFQGVVELRKAMDAAQTELVQAADRLAVACGAELARALQRFAKSPTPEAARQLWTQAQNGDQVLLRIYGLAAPAPQFEELEEAIQQAKELYAGFRQPADARGAPGAPFARLRGPPRPPGGPPSAE